MSFEPKIVGLFCNWCSYTGADNAGIARKKYPANLRIIRLMCSGRIDPTFIIKAFEQGADGVLIGGCHIPSDCHYQNGNYKTMRRFPLLVKLLGQMGIEKERLRLEWISASEGIKLVQVVTEMTAKIKALGPLHSGDGKTAKTADQTSKTEVGEANA